MARRGEARCGTRRRLRSVLFCAAIAAGAVPSASGLAQARCEAAQGGVPSEGCEAGAPTAEPAGGADEPQTADRHAPIVSISPDSGPPGAAVRVEASGLPADVAISIGGGRPGAPHRILSVARTDWSGALAANVRVPETAAGDARWAFVLVLDGRVAATSEPFEITGTPAPGIRVRGTLTDEGVECPALRADSGELYTLAGQLDGLGPGDSVEVEGRVMEVSFCIQGTTIQVTRIRRTE